MARACAALGMRVLGVRRCDPAMISPRPRHDLHLAPTHLAPRHRTRRTAPCACALHTYAMSTWVLALRASTTTNSRHVHIHRMAHGHLHSARARARVHVHVHLHAPGARRRAASSSRGAWWPTRPRSCIGCCRAPPRCSSAFPGCHPTLWRLQPHLVGSATPLSRGCNPT